MTLEPECANKPRPDTCEVTVIRLLQDIQDEWQSRSQEIPWGAHDPRWTDWIKSTFHHIGDRELKGCGTKDVHWGIESTQISDTMGQGEYLVDVCWWTRREGRYRLELAVESEWNRHRSEIEHDFYKLIDVKSRLKIWVCSYDKQLDSRLTDMITVIRSVEVRSQDEKYLVLNLPEKAQVSDFISSIMVQPFAINWQGEMTRLPTFAIERAAV